MPCGSRRTPLERILCCRMLPSILCSTEIKACVVDLSGRQPNWLLSRYGSKYGVSQSLTNPAKTLAAVGNREIDLRSFWMEVRGWTLGIGMISAAFHIGGKNPLWGMHWKWLLTPIIVIRWNPGEANLECRPGQEPYVFFMLARRRSTSEGSITKSGMWGSSSSNVWLGSKGGRQPEILTKKSLISSAIGTSDWYSCKPNYDPIKPQYNLDSDFIKSLLSPLAQINNQRL